jgi:serine/threonine-protein kinase
MTETGTLIELLTETRLLTPDQIAEVRGLVLRLATNTALGAELVRRGWLTPLQLRWLARGRGRRLVLGPYVLLERLGVGGMGQVFLARHRELGRRAAVKVIRPDRRDCPRVRARFLREVRAVGRLNHLNVVHPYDAGVVGRTYYLAMEHVPGPDLDRLLRSAGPLDPGIACDYARQAALGLSHMHEQGLIHRDVKPGNLALAFGGRVVKVLDIGLARRTDGHSVDPNLSQVGKLVGSADYAAPEQLRDPRGARRRSDVYSLGCTLYHLLTGQVPFPGGTPVDKAVRHLKDQPRPIEELRPGLPAGLAAVVRRMMARRARNRFETMAAAAAALAAFAVPGGVPTGGDCPTAEQSALPTDYHRPG